MLFVFSQTRTRRFLLFFGQMFRTVSAFSFFCQSFTKDTQQTFENSSQGVDIRIVSAHCICLNLNQVTAVVAAVSEAVVAVSESVVAVSEAVVVAAAAVVHVRLTLVNNRRVASMLGLATAVAADHYL